jgi:hypothetical protein
LPKSDRYAALFFVALSIFVCQQAAVIGIGSLRKPGPGLLAFGAGFGVGLLALAVFVRSFLFPSESGKEEEETSRRRGKFFVICASLFVYAGLIRWVGFTGSTFLFVLFLFRAVETERWWRSLAKSALIAAGNYLVFVTWLGISLPKGFWAG